MATWKPGDVITLVILAPLVGLFVFSVLFGMGAIRRGGRPERFRCCCGRCRP